MVRIQTCPKRLKKNVSKKKMCPNVSKTCLGGFKCVQNVNQTCPTYPKRVQRNSDQGFDVAQTASNVPQKILCAQVSTIRVQTCPRCAQLNKKRVQCVHRTQNVPKMCPTKTILSTLPKNVFRVFLRGFAIHNLAASSSFQPCVFYRLTEPILDTPNILAAHCWEARPEIKHRSGITVNSVEMCRQVCPEISHRNAITVNSIA